MSTTSITRRLVVTLTIGATALWLIGSLVTILLVQDALQRTLDGGLRETAERLLPLAVDGLTDDGDGDRDAEGYHEPMLESGRGEYVVYQVRSPTHVLMRSHDAPTQPFAAPLAEGFVTAPPWRIYTTGDARSGLFIQVAESEDRRNTALWGSVAALLIPLLLLIPASIFGIRYAVDRGLAPLRLLGEEVGRRDVANLELVGMPDAPTELKPMIRAIDGLLLRLRAAFEAERALAANSAHELRTPIAGSLAQTQRLVEELDGHPAQARARNVEGTLHRLSALASKLLALSRAESGVARLPSPIDLIPAVDLTLGDAARTLGARLIVVRRPKAHLAGALDLDALGIVMRNLIENAVKHGSTGGPITVTIGENVLDISSEGPIVSPERLGMLVRRFERGDATSDGSGLGLAIVDTILQQVGGTLELRSPAIGRDSGFTARVAFPQREQGG
ncbi:HAMP domain-containing sensor histidine kinase [Devosia sp. ZB163]|uniref:sensor histidine kinase n=1 Tax=Devosia sp. ZB163 TaxID=3025938 RepID=UPI0023623BE2|nr:HAMP domain-containing sensor histidine kinase [Devosia sp. ZB163]MDC9822768.1 HAMP domain-containing sensor histidine kinase [Devosia sp. ZB163]